MRSIKESEELADLLISVIHGLLMKNNMSIAINNGDLYICDHDIDRNYRAEI